MLDFLYNPKGRISRKGYLLGFFVPSILIGQILPGILGATPLAPLGAIASALFFLPGIFIVPVKRFHDMGASGWYQLGFLGLLLLCAVMIIQSLGTIDPTQPMTMAEVFEVAMASPRGQLGIGLAAFVNVAQFLLMIGVKGQEGANRFGNDPLASGRGFAD